MKELEVEVLYEKGPCLAVAKPPGLLTQAPPGIDSLELRIKAFLKHRDAKLGNVYLGVPHRLDRPVSGAMVFAKHSRAARRLAEQFEGRSVRKVYWACVEGRVTPEAGTWEDFMRKVPGEARAEALPPDHPDAQLAVLQYRVLGHWPWGTWLEIVLQTGRTHQVRLQASLRGHPVLGDALYGARTTFGPQCDDPRERAIALHARQLAFYHPMTRESVTVLAPLPAPWSELGLPELQVART